MQHAPDSGLSLNAPEVPATLDELLTPEWLTAALSQRFPSVKVTGVIPGPVVNRLSTNARFAIESADGLPEGLAPTLCAKGYFSEMGRPLPSWVRPRSASIETWPIRSASGPFEASMPTCIRSRGTVW